MPPEIRWPSLILMVFHRPPSTRGLLILHTLRGDPSGGRARRCAGESSALWRHAVSRSGRVRRGHSDFRGRLPVRPLPLVNLSKIVSHFHREDRADCPVTAYR
jgi:hypothetical protein